MKIEMKAKEIKKCVICGKEFEPLRKGHKTCSRECSKKNTAEAIKKWRETHKEKYRQYGRNCYWRKKRRS